MYSQHCGTVDNARRSVLVVEEEMRLASALGTSGMMIADSLMWPKASVLWTAAFELLVALDIHRRCACERLAWTYRKLVDGAPLTFEVCPSAQKSFHTTDTDGYAP